MKKRLAHALFSPKKVNPIFLLLEINTYIWRNSHNVDHLSEVSLVSPKGLF